MKYLFSFIIIFWSILCQAIEYSCPSSIDISTLNSERYKDWTISKSKNGNTENNGAEKIVRFKAIDFFEGEIPLVSRYTLIPNNDSTANEDGYVLWTFADSSEQKIYQYVGCIYENSDTQLVKVIGKGLNECRIPMENKVEKNMLQCK